MAERTRADMRNLAYCAETIRSSVSALEVGKALGLNPDSDGRCRCPIHGGRNRNLKLYDGDGGYYCFKCHAGGDSIRLVEEVSGCDFPGAIEWINSAFHLGLDVNAEPDHKAEMRAEIKRQWRRYLDKLDRDFERLNFEIYLNAVGMVADAEFAVQEYAPFYPDEEWDPRFVAALKALPDLRESMENACMNTIKRKEI